MENYLNLKLGAKARLQILRNSAKNGKWVNPMTWRNCRFANFKTTSTLNCGSNDSKPIYYSFEPAFNSETMAHEIINIRHSGWYCDTDQSNLAIGIVIKFPHSRYIAGYKLSDSGERVYFPEIYTDKNDAAHAADYHAEKIANLEMEYAQKYHDAQKLESTIDDSFARLKECLILRNVACMHYVRSEIVDLIETIRESRETLKSDFAGVL